MPKVVRIRNVNLHCLSSEEADRLPNIHFGKNCNVITNNLLRKTPFLNRYVNDETMGALDNYAQHENLRIFITPLESDLLDDLAVSVYKKYGSSNENFAIKIEEGKEGVPKFFRELYNKVAEAAHKLSGQ